MDIQIVRTEVVDDTFIHIERKHKDGDKEWTSLNRMPKEILAVRAAEYDLEVDDPRVLDAVLLEPFFEPHAAEVHPLFTSNTIAEALTHLEGQIAATKKKHTHNKGTAKDLLLKHAPRDIAWAVKLHRDHERAKYMAPRKTLGSQIKDAALSKLQSEAIEEDLRRG